MAAFIYRQKKLNPMSRLTVLGKTRKVPAFSEKSRRFALLAEPRTTGGLPDLPASFFYGHRGAPFCLGKA